MLKQQLAIIAVLALCTTMGCSSGGGGGGGNANHDPMTGKPADIGKTQTISNHMDARPKTTMVTNFTAEGRNFVEAYARVPWVHANVAAENWSKALDDLRFIDKQLTDLDKDRDVGMPVKAQVTHLMPMVATLNQQIRSHNRAALVTAASLNTQFSRLTNDRVMLTWIGNHSKGGGGGR
jgi:hypothetical protein